jgi:hypothetical protein
VSEDWTGASADIVTVSVVTGVGYTYYLSITGFRTNEKAPVKHRALTGAELSSLA